MSNKKSEMSEQEHVVAEGAETTEEEFDWGTSQNGIVKGIPGEKACINGVLDLRGVPAEQVATIKALLINGVILMDEQNRNALSNAKTQINGTMMVASPELKVLAQPDIHFTKEMVEAMPAGQKMLLIGFTTIDRDVPGAVLAEKFEQLIIMGFLITYPAIQGALLGKLEITGITILLKDDGGPVVRNMGQNTLAAGYLERLQDGSTYINIGQTEVPKDIPEALVARKIGSYVNVGQTTASEAVIMLLKTRCDTNLGQMHTWEEVEAKQREEG